MISKERHNETTRDGRYIYVIEMPARCTEHSHPELNRKMYKVKFWEGVGKTVHRDKARYFDEQLGYTVYLHKKDLPWENASLMEVPTLQIGDEELVDVDGEFEEEDTD